MALDPRLLRSVWVRGKAGTDDTLAYSAFVIRAPENFDFNYLAIYHREALHGTS